jgi:uncharacterized protein YdaU (DUF1376 family)
MIFWARYVGDYGRDTGDLSLMEHGAYTLLLDCYYAGERGPPADLSALYRICRAMTPKEQAAVHRVVARFFVSDGTSLRNERCEKEIERSRRIRAKARESARSRWTKRGADADASACANGDAPGDAVGRPDAMPSQAQAQKKKTDMPTAAAAGFEAFWRVYPRKEARGRAARVWQRLAPPASVQTAMVAAIAWQVHEGCLRPQSCEGRSLVPLPASWLNDRRWEDTKPSSAAGSATRALNPDEQAATELRLRIQNGWTLATGSIHVGVFDSKDPIAVRALAEIGGLSVLARLPPRELEQKGVLFTAAYRRLAASTADGGVQREVANG